MTPLDVLQELLERVGASRDSAALVSEEELSRWPAEAVRELKSQKLLVKASPPVSVVCPGCEQECFMPVETPLAETGAATSFVVCDKRDDINRVAIPAARLRKWRCGVEAVGAFVARSLGLRAESQSKTEPKLLELGIVTGKERSQMVCLVGNYDLELAIGNQAVRLTEVVCFDPAGYSIVRERIERLVDYSTTGDSRYTPSTVRREARKLKTRSLHEKWQKAYRSLKRNHPEKSDKWCSDRIARMGIKPERSAETIRKHMKF